MVFSNLGQTNTIDANTVSVILPSLGGLLKLKIVNYTQLMMCTVGANYKKAYVRGSNQQQKHRLKYIPTGYCSMTMGYGEMFLLEQQN